MTLSVSYFDFDSLKMPGVIEEFYSAKEAMDAAENEMSLSRLTLSNDNEEKGEYGDFFPFATLPDELIGHTFSFLPIKDRLRSRVNRRLNKIELQSKYYVEQLLVMEYSENSPEQDEPYYDKFQKITFLDQVVYSSDCIRRLTHNVSIGYLDIVLHGTVDFHREVFHLIKDFDIGILCIRFGNDDFENEMVVDSFFLDLARACEELDMFTSSDNITPQAFHQVYKMNMDRSTKLRKVDTSIIADKQLIPFLSLIGITYRDGRFFSERKIEAIENVVRRIGYAERHHMSLFDGSFEISFILLKGPNRDGRIVYDFDFDFSLEMHETEESLDKAKNRDGFVRVKIVPE